jgi:hypothetical protein
MRPGPDGRHLPAVRGTAETRRRADVSIAITPAQQELDHIVLHLKGLVWVRARLEQSGAPQAELDQHTAEIDALRTRLARLVQRLNVGGESAA